MKEKYANNTWLMVLLLIINPVSLFLPLSAQEVKISVFNSLPVKTVTITANSGKYAILNGDEKIGELHSGEALYVSLFNNKLVLQNTTQLIGSYDSISMNALAPNADMHITPVDPKVKGKTCPDNLTLRIDYERIMIINNASIERYIAGVVEAEAGTKALPEFYKAQALLCRTYLYSHIHRHESEGFNLCDEVHCQAYRGITGFTNTIFASTSETKGKVVVAADSSFITASFHGNCGGETESSGNTWLKGKDYLVPVKDPYCQQKPNASWTKEIPEADWISYLKKQGFKLKSHGPGALEMRKTGRQQYYSVGDDSTLTKQIRTDWNLKSSYFQVLVKNNKVILQGHGFGHGVGLCQDGAMQMAVIGFRCEEIIHFYFTGVRIVPIREAELK